MKLNTFLLTTTCIIGMVACRESNDLSTSAVPQQQDVNYDYTIHAVTSDKELTIAGYYDTAQYMQYTEVAGGSIVNYEWKYYDDNAMWFEQDGDHSVRYVNGNFDTSYYSVRFDNISFQRTAIRFDLVIAGQTVGQVTVTAADKDDIPSNIRKMLAKDNKPYGRLMKKLGQLIPPIDISLGNSTSITINNGNGNVNVNNNSYGGSGQPCTVSAEVAKMCYEAGNTHAGYCLQVGGKPNTYHGPCHNGCRFDCL